MSITSAKSGATGISLALDNNYMEPIATTLVGSGGVNTVIFNDIPQTYKHLQIRAIGRCNRTVEASDAVFMRFNGDTASNYSYHGLAGNGSAASAFAGATQTFVLLMDCTAAGAATSIFNSAMCDILDYANTNKNKTTRSLTGFDTNGAGTVMLTSSNWRDTNAITSITLTPANGSWVQYSRISLYGIKG